MAKKAKKQGFSIQGFDVEHYRQTDGYCRAIDKLYDSAIHSFSRLAGSLKIDPDKPFDFASRPAFKRRAQEIVDQLASSMTAVIQHGTRDQWLYACKKNDAFIEHIMNTAKIGKRQLKKMQDKNLDALSAFQERKVNGLDLSQRVWHYAGQTKGLMELGIDIAVGDGKSAEELSRDLREYLLEPDKLFRRVRDKHGNLVLSKRAAAYHPGQGVYRSSYKNAMRLARTEINMAYRDSDRYRWNDLDFIVGYTVHLSNNHTLNGKPFHDICDELAGDYPKDFVFKGWHPHCRCFVTPILQDPEEFKTDELNELKAAFFGTEYKKFQSKNTPKGLPKGFKDWIKVHKEQSLKWSKQPYWIRDNFEGGTLEGKLKLMKPVIAAPKPKKNTRFIDLSDKEQQRLRDRWHSICSDQLYKEIEAACEAYHVSDDLFMDLYYAMMTEYWKLDQLESETKRLTAELDATAKRLGVDAQSWYDKAINAWEESRIWAKNSPARDLIDIKWKGEIGWRWPNYPSLMDELKRFYDQRTEDVRVGKDLYNSTVYDCKVVIKKAESKGLDTQRIWDLIGTQPTESRNAQTLVREMKIEMNRLEDLMVANDPNGEWTDIMEIGKVNKVVYKEVGKLTKPLSEDEIIQRVGGGDLTQGSCSSLAFTYAANRCGFDVLDFRDGESRRMFSRSSNIMNVARKLGGVVVDGKNELKLGAQLLAQVEEGKEYYFTCGAHAAIVRKHNGSLEYLELQSSRRNGFTKFDTSTLKWRFGAKTKRTHYGMTLTSTECLIDIEKFKGIEAFRRMMGFINTSEGAQRKGMSGTMK